MFTGIVQKIGLIENLKRNIDSIDFHISTPIANDLTIGQSISHNGICLTLTDLINNKYTTTAVEETIQNTTIKNWKKGDYINLEKSLVYGDAIDGHIVQGHIDCTAICTKVLKKEAGYYFTFKYPQKFQDLIYQKGSIAINGVSLTIAKILDQNTELEVAIIPHTFEQTTFKNLKINDLVNFEFDSFAKQIKRQINLLKL
tara:strand:+ start:210 stop:809 length:600 start_codon:yes stop_codon:yes gene_type:complete